MSTLPRTVDAPTVARFADMLRHGHSRDEVIEAMRSAGLNKIESIKVLRDYGGLTLGRAKDEVESSPAWADRRESDRAFHDALAEAVEASC